MSLLLDSVVGSNNNDPLSFDLDNKFEFSNLTDKEFSKIKLVLLEDVIEKYPFEKGIIEMCMNKLNKLRDHVKVEFINSKLKTSDIWDTVSYTHLTLPTKA